MTQPGRAWTQQEREALLDRVRAGERYTAVAKSLRRTEAECRAEAEALRRQGWTAAGATRRMRAPPPSRKCLCCRELFAPRSRFNFLCAPCGAQDAGLAA